MEKKADNKVIIALLILFIIATVFFLSKNDNKPSIVQPEQQTPIAENNEGKSIAEEQPNIDSNQGVVNTEKTEIISPSNNNTPSGQQKSPTEIKLDSEISTATIIETHCQSEWPNDAKMKNYCIEQQNDGLVTLNLGKTKDISDNDFIVVRDKCKNEWPTDFKMCAYCESQQYDGIRTLKQGKPADIGQTEFGIIRSKCEKEWSTDFKMRAYCESQQYDAIRTLNLGKPADVSESDFNSVRSSCASEWPTDYNMRVYCEKQKF